MSDFFTQLMARPTTRTTRLSRYTEACGFSYCALGAVIFLWPDSIVLAGLSIPFQGQEQGLMRVIGCVLMLIGYFYVFGGRTQQNSFGLCTVVDRLLVPVLFGFIYFTSDISGLFILAIGIGDPLLGMGAYFCWRVDESEKHP